MIRAVETETAQIILEDDGIVRQMSLTCAEETEKTAEENVKVWGQMSKVFRPLVLMDIRGALSMTRKAREHYRGHEACRALAVLAESGISRMIAVFIIIGSCDVVFPLARFESLMEAEAWLKEQE